MDSVLLNGRGLSTVITTVNSLHFNAISLLAITSHCRAQHISTTTLTVAFRRPGRRSASPHPSDITSHTLETKKWVKIFCSSQTAILTCAPAGEAKDSGHLFLNITWTRRHQGGKGKVG